MKQRRVPTAKTAAGLKASYHKAIRLSLAKVSCPAQPTPREQEVLSARDLFRLQMTRLPENNRVAMGKHSARDCQELALLLLTTPPLQTTPSWLLLALSPQSDKMAKVSSTFENPAVAPTEKMLMVKSQDKNRERQGKQYLILREMEVFERKGNNPSRLVDAPGRESTKM